MCAGWHRRDCGLSCESSAESGRSGGSGGGLLGIGTSLLTAALGAPGRATGGPVAELDYFEAVAALRWLMTVSHEARQQIGLGKASHAPFMLSMREPVAAAAALIYEMTGVALPDPEILLT